MAQQRTEKEISEEIDGLVVNSDIPTIDGYEGHYQLLAKAKELEFLARQERASKMALINEYVLLSLGRETQRKNSPIPYNLRRQF